MSRGVCSTFDVRNYLIDFFYLYMGCCSSTQTDKPLLSIEPEDYFYHEHTEEHTQIHTNIPVSDEIDI